MEKEVTFKGKKYKIIGCTSSGFAIADFRAKTKTKDYGWKPVKNYTIRRALAKKYCKQ